MLHHGPIMAAAFLGLISGLGISLVYISISIFRLYLSAYRAASSSIILGRNLDNVCFADLGCRDAQADRAVEQLTEKQQGLEGAW